MTAAMLVLEPIFEADLPSELYAYRPGRNLVLVLECNKARHGVRTGAIHTDLAVVVHRHERRYSQMAWVIARM